jgi:hypothetical protein
LAVDHAVQIFTGEHFSRTVHPWSCSAAPVHDPQTGAILGVLDLTGGDDVAAPQSLVVVRAAVAAIEAELRLQLLARPRGRGPRPQMIELARLAVLGRSDAELRWGDRVVTLSLRHAELLLLLALHPEGRSAEQLAVDLHHSDPPLVTIRAEMSRLRRLLGEQAMTSRPYRLTRPLRTDVEELRTLLVRGAHRKALEHYRGPVLPRSCAPAIEELRAEVAAEVREAILRHGAPEVLASYAESPSGTDDVRALRAAVAALSPGSPRRTMLRARLTLLERAVGPAATSLATRLQPSRS